MKAPITKQVEEMARAVEKLAPKQSAPRPEDITPADAIRLFTEANRARAIPRQVADMLRALAQDRDAERSTKEHFQEGYEIYKQRDEQREAELDRLKDGGIEAISSQMERIVTENLAETKQELREAKALIAALVIRGPRSNPCRPLQPARAEGAEGGTMTEAPTTKVEEMATILQGEHPGFASDVTPIKWEAAAMLRALAQDRDKHREALGGALGRVAYLESRMTELEAYLATLPCPQRFADPNVEGDWRQGYHCSDCALERRGRYCHTSPQSREEAPQGGGGKTAREDKI